MWVSSCTTLPYAAVYKRARRDKKEAREWEGDKERRKGERERERERGEDEDDGRERSQGSVGGPYDRSSAMAGFCPPRHTTLQRCGD